MFNFLFQDLTPEQAEARILELDAVHCAERGDTESAIKLFTKAIERCPNDPSCYNNRAQARRLAKDIPGMVVNIDKIQWKAARFVSNKFRCN